MATTLDNPEMSPVAKPLCPQCGGRRMRLSSSVPVHYDLAFDVNLQDFVVVGEKLDEPEWDDASDVGCPSCGWAGRLTDLA